MAGWVGALAAEHSDNWEICKERRLWGTTAANARPVTTGDDLFIWRSVRAGLVGALSSPLPRSSACSGAGPMAGTGAVQVGLRHRGGHRVVGSPPHARAGAPRRHWPAHRPVVPIPATRAAGSRASPQHLRGTRPLHPIVSDLDLPDGYDERETALGAIALRRGQRAFRLSLVEAYAGQCAISRCAVDAVLEAAHIAPYRGPLTDDVRNGLLLRADLHTLFDLHLVTVLPVGAVRTSPALAGTDYESFDERFLRKPARRSETPDSEALAAHNAACSWLTE